MSMPEALDIDAMKGSGSSKAGKEPVGAEVFVGTYYRSSGEGDDFATDAPEYGLTSPILDGSRQYLLRQDEEKTVIVTEINLEGDPVGEYQLLNVVREDEVLPAVGLGDREIIIREDGEDVSGTKLLDGSIELVETGTRFASISPCVCDTAEYLVDPFELTEDLTIETKAFFDILEEGRTNIKTSFVCTRLVRQGKGWIGLGINPGRPENDSGEGDNAPPNPPRNAMQGAEAVIGTLKDGDQPQAVLKYHLNGGGQRVELFPPEKQTLVCPSITYNKKRDETTMVFGKYFQEEGEYEIKPGEENTFLYAYGGTTLGYHGGLNRGVFSSTGPDNTIEILCAGTGEGSDTVPPRTPCPKCSYAGSVPECDVPDRL